MKKILLSLTVFAVTFALVLPKAEAIYEYDPFDEPTYKTAVLKTEHFWIEYSKDDFYSHNISPDNNQNNTDDRIDDIADLFEEVWAAEIDDLGFMAPDGSEEDGRILVIIDEDYDYIDSDYMGMTYVDSDLKPYIVLDFNLDEPELSFTVAHEFFHAIQFGYDPYFYAFYSDLNFSEGSANAIAEYVLEDVSLTESFGSYYFENYWESLYGSSMYDETFPYATYLWSKFLMAEYGEDTVREIFETFFDMTSSGDYYLDMYQATNLALQFHNDTDIFEAFREFTIWNYDVDRYGDDTLDDGVKDYGLSEYVTEYPYFRGVTGYDGVMSLTAPFGVSYVDFEPSDIEGNLEISVYGQSDAKWMVTILTKKGRKVSEYDHRIVYQNESEVSFVVENADSYADIVMVMSPVPSSFYSVSDFDEYYSYSYYAEDVYGVESKGTSGFEEGGIVEDLFYDFGMDDEYFYPVKVLKTAGIIEGYQNSTFQTDRVISRAEVVKMLIEAFLPNADISGGINCFKDVYEGWYEEYVCYAEELGWVEGYDNGYFYPLGSVDKVTAVKVMMDVFGIDVSDENGVSMFADVESDEWYSSYLNRAYRWGLFDQKKGYRFDPENSLTRGEFADMLYRLIGVIEMDADVDGEGVSDVEVRDYFVFDEGEEFTFAVYDEDGERIGTEIVANINDCVGYTVCTAQESAVGRSYYYYKDDEVRVYREVTDGGEIVYYDPLLVLSDEDVVEYSKIDEGYLMVEGVEAEILDVVSSADVSNVAYIYADGVKYSDDVLKVDSKRLMNFRVVVGLENFYGVLEQETTTYWVPDVGLVKNVTSGVVDFAGSESEIGEVVWELVD